MRLAILASGSRIAEAVCEDGPVYVGSAADCAVRLPDERIPPQVAVLYPEDETWVLQPLDSEHELKLNGVQVTERLQLRSGDQLSVGEFVVRAEIDEPPKAQRVGISVASMARFVQFQLPPASVVKRIEDPITLAPGFMHRVCRINVDLAALETPEQVMNVTLASLLEIFGGQRAWIGIRRVNYGSMEYVEGRRAGGQATDLPDIGESLQPRVLDRGQFVVIPHAGVEHPFSILSGPLQGPDGPLGMLYVDNAETGRRFEAQDLEHFLGVSCAIGAQLDAILKRIAKVRAATLDGEVVVAHAIQSRLTPRKLPQWDQLQFGAFREPGRQRSSDVYDLVRLQNQSAAIMIAHTNAGGPLPGMVMAQTQSAFRSSVMHMDAPHVFLRSLNLVLYDPTSDHRLDAFMAVIDPPSGTMRFSLGGEIGAFIIGQRGIERRIGPEPALPALAAARQTSYATYEEQLESGETLVLFTPGVITAQNRKGETFGQERFINILCDGFGQLASAMLKEMLSDLQNFTEGGLQPEDITVILAHRV